MNNGATNTHAPAEPQRTLHVVGKLPSNDEVQTDARVRLVRRTAFA
jgi:hypothetical protein